MNQKHNSILEILENPVAVKKHMTTDWTQLERTPDSTLKHLKA